MIYILNNREIDQSTIEISGVDSTDYPAFTDAWLSEACWLDDGGMLSDDDLQELGEAYPHLPAELAFESLIL